MTAKEALNLYKSRDISEKLFRGDKSYLGDKSLRVYGDSAAGSKIFIEFIVLVIRNRIYRDLKEEMLKLEKRPNYMTVPAALRELEKIEIIRFVTRNKVVDLTLPEFLRRQSKCQESEEMGREGQWNSRLKKRR